MWIELHRQATDDDLDLLEAVLSSWFMIGRLGGFNAMNLQASLASPVHVVICLSVDVRALLRFSCNAGVLQGS